MPIFNSCTTNAGSPGTPPYARLTSSFLGIDAWMNSQLKLALINKATWIIYVLGLLFDMLPVGVCTTRHWQTPGRLLQELDIFTVGNIGNVPTLVFTAISWVSLSQKWISRALYQISGIIIIIIINLSLLSSFYKYWVWEVVFATNWIPCPLSSLTTAVNH